MLIESAENYQAMTQRQFVGGSRKKQCRICLEDEETQILISPCACKGSIQFVHANCLKEYFKHKYKAAARGQRKRMKNCLECEICKREIRAIQVLPIKRCITCQELRLYLETEDYIFLSIYLFLYLAFHAVGIIMLLQESIVAKIIGAIWLAATVLGYNYGLYKIFLVFFLVKQASIESVQVQ